MATIYNQRKVRHFAMEKVDMERLERAAKKLQVHPSWLINQAVNLAIDNDAGARAAYAKEGIKTKNPASLPDMGKFWHLK